MLGLRVQLLGRFQKSAQTLHVCVYIHMQMCFCLGLVIVKPHVSSLQVDMAPCRSGDKEKEKEKKEQKTDRKGKTHSSSSFVRGRSVTRAADRPRPAELSHAVPLDQSTEDSY